MRTMHIGIAALSFLLLLVGVSSAERLRLATTTSTENSGLLAELLPPFEKAHDVKVDVIAVGTGKAIKLGESGDVDIILVHARDRGDDSGTHTKEKALWSSADIVPAGPWYLEAGRGMGEVITMATERQGYTLTDRGTYIACAPALRRS